MIAWPSGVNKTISSETSWAPTDGIIRDKMRSGKDKERLSSSSVPDVFSVVMYFTRTEYNIFDSWFKLGLRRGALSFAFPTIAGTGTSEYKITSVPNYSSLGGETVKVTMQWSSQ